MESAPPPLVNVAAPAFALLLPDPELGAPPPPQLLACCSSTSPRRPSLCSCPIPTRTAPPCPNTSSSSPWRREQLPWSTLTRGTERNPFHGSWMDLTRWRPPGKTGRANDEMACNSKSFSPTSNTQSGINKEVGAHAQHS